MGDRMGFGATGGAGSLLVATMGSSYSTDSSFCTIGVTSGALVATFCSS